MLQQWLVDNILTVLGGVFVAGILYQTQKNHGKALSDMSAVLKSFVDEYQKDRLAIAVRAAEQARDIKAIADALAAHEKICDTDRAAIRAEMQNLRK